MQLFFTPRRRGRVRTRFAALLAIPLFFLLPLAACHAPQASENVGGTNAGSSAPAGKLERFDGNFLGVFDTVTRVIAYAENKADFDKELDFIHQELTHYHQLFDIYHDYSGLTNLKSINDHAGKGPIKVDSAILGMLKYSKDAYTLTEGRVNIALGSVLSIWHDHREAGLANPEHATLPKIEDLKAANQHCNIDDLIINEKDSTVELKDPQMSLDVGAIAKGYATELVARACEEKGYAHILISVGGNVRAIGERGVAPEDWHVAVQNPDPSQSETKPYLMTLKIREASMVTSGVYERYYTVNGKRYHHIIDPDTLFPETRFLSVTILTHDSGLADTLSTALFNLPYEKGKALLDKIGHVDALWVFPDGSTKETVGFKDHVLTVY